MKYMSNSLNNQVMTLKIEMSGDSNCSLIGTEFHKILCSTFTCLKVAQAPPKESGAYKS